MATPRPPVTTTTSPAYTQVITMTTATTSSPRVVIRLQGELSADWLDYFGPFEMGWERDIEAAPVTVLKGPVIDQSAMIGMINHLHDLSLRLISFEYESQS